MLTPVRAYPSLSEVVKFDECPTSPDAAARTLTHVRVLVEQENEVAVPLFLKTLYLLKAWTFVPARPW